MLTPVRILRLSPMILGLSLMMGCGGGGTKLPEMGAVSGTITHKGKPVPMAMVVFMPSEKGAVSSSAQTDAEGKYTLRYMNGDEGVAIGKHRVEVTTGAATDPSKPAPPPMAYNVADEQTVVAGDNSFDFDLGKLGNPRLGG
jgi:hypothetical protein